MVGVDAPLDTGQLQVLGIDFLGGSAGSSGPATGERFPSVTTGDQARLLLAVLDDLAIERLHGFVGASYGGMVGLAFAAAHPTRLERLVVLSAAHRTHPLATAWRSVQRAVVRDAIARGEGPRGLALARALAMATYRSARELDERFDGPARATAEGFRFPVEDYLFARGASYASQYRPESFVCLSESIDLHRVDPQRIHAPATLLAVVEDQIVPLADMRQLRDRLAGGAQLVEIDSVYGHDAFLKETDVLRDLLAHALY
jgi:homoserine O-acetyltransferase